MAEAGRLVVLLGIVLVVAGVAMTLNGRFSLPGDFTYRRGGFTLFAPIGTMLLVSIALTILLNVFLRIGH